MPYENILVETDGSVGVIHLNRPQALNALNDALIAEVSAALAAGTLSQPSSTSPAARSPERIAPSM